MKSTLRLSILTFVVAALLATPAGAAPAKPCQDANLVPTDASQMPRLQTATRCLVNRERTKRGLRALKTNADLLESAQFQAKDMLKNAYFDHARPGGPDFVERVLRFGYADDAAGYAIGENLGWASAPIATPRKMVALWMASPPHREEILTRGYRDQAVAALWSDGGVGGDYKDSGGPFVIYVNHFGTLY